ncbi:MAG: nuclear transport factor 2 family protein [Acidobacteria bacterium]|nr:nuclear transport factor 2 family protein [Acidobacteriota bacterium]
MRRSVTVMMLMLMLTVPALAQKTRKAIDKHKIEQELMQLERDWSAAFLAHDVATAARILADDYVGIDGRGMMTNKAEELEEAQAPTPGALPSTFIIQEETISDMQVRLYGDTAVVTGISNEKVLIRGKESFIRYRRTSVYVKRQGRWQCVSFHGSRILEPPK